MKIIAVSRIGNEADIIEAFIRHTAMIADSHIIMTDGISDATLDILNRLQAGGVALTILDNTKVYFNETRTNTRLYRLAVEAGADWVLFLDADEFANSRGQSLRDTIHDISTSRPDLAVLKLQSFDYVTTSQDPQGELIVPKRMTYRRPPNDNWKVLVKRDLYAKGVEIQPGNHCVSIGGAVYDAFPAPKIVLAHYPERSVYQWLAKAVLGWAKVLAAGNAALQDQVSNHYHAPFKALLENPAAILRDPAMMAFHHDDTGLICDPLRYLGGPLQFTAPVDDQMHAVQLLLNTIYLLARQHGQLVDGDRLVRGALEQWFSKFDT